MTIVWGEGTPGARSDVSTGAQAIRDLKVAISDGLQPSMYWPPEGSLASAGEMKHGTFRVTEPGLASALDVGTDPRLLFVTSDTSRLYGQCTSSTSHRLGGAWGVEHGTLSTRTSRWVMDGGTSESSSVVTFTTPYLGVPFVGLSSWRTLSGYSSVGLVVHSATSVGFTGSIHAWSDNTLDPGFVPGETSGTMVWMSLGTQAF